MVVCSSLTAQITLIRSRGFIFSTVSLKDYVSIAILSTILLGQIDDQTFEEMLPLEIYTEPSTSSCAIEVCYILISEL